MARNRLCCYSLVLPGAARPDLINQLLTSVGSLRAHNRDIAVVLFGYGHLPPELTAPLEQMGVRIWHLGSYESRLANMCARGWPTLSHYPLLHKFLNFAEISSMKPDQVLLLDCDTYFNGDVALLFDQYADKDLVAREEVGSRRNHHGYDPKMVDEDELNRIGAEVGIKPALPINIGVVLMNNGLWHRLAGLSSLHVQYAWRFVLWMASQSENRDSEFGEGLGIDYLRQNWHSVAPDDEYLALPFPSSNPWILDEVTLWMTLGHLPETTYSDFTIDDVVQNGEFDTDTLKPTWVVCHYFSNNMDRIAQWIHDRQQKDTDKKTDDDTSESSENS